MYEQYMKHSKLVNRNKLDLIYTNQELVFEHYFEKPHRSKRYKSFFRMDGKPGCRFQYYRGKLYFIDNNPPNGYKLYSDCIRAVSQHFGLSDAEAVNTIINDLGLVYDPNVVNNSYIVDEVKHKPIIKFRPIKQDEESYFNKVLGITDDSLWNFNCFLVGDYWANTKNEPVIKKNIVGNPKEEEVYAFYSKKLDGANLYFPNRDENKFYKGLPTTYFYGEESVDFDYSQPLIVSKSGKDALVIKKLYPNVVAVQTELRMVDNPILKKFPQVLIWYDNDYVGYSKSEEYKVFLQNKGLNNVSVHHHPDFMQKDPADMYVQNNRVFENYFYYEVRREFSV